MKGCTPVKYLYIFTEINLLLFWLSHFFIPIRCMHKRTPANKIAWQMPHCKKIFCIAVHICHIQRSCKISRGLNQLDISYYVASVVCVFRTSNPCKSFWLKFFWGVFSKPQWQNNTIFTHIWEFGSILPKLTNHLLNHV